MEERRNVVISTWIPQPLAEAIRIKAFLERRSKSDLLRALLWREFGEEAKSHGFDIEPPGGERQQ